jgi:hypothetical protein
LLWKKILTIKSLEEYNILDEIGFGNINKVKEIIYGYEGK